MNKYVHSFLLEDRGLDSRWIYPSSGGTSSTGKIFLATNESANCSDYSYTTDPTELRKRGPCVTIIQSNQYYPIMRVYE